MADHVENCRSTPAKFLRFIQNGRRVKARYNLITKFSYTVAVPRFCRSHLLKVRRRFDPLFRPPVKCDVIQNVLAQFLLLVCPVVCAPGCWQRSNSANQIFLQLKSCNIRRLYRHCEQAFESPSRRLAIDRGCGQRKQDRTCNRITTSSQHHLPAPTIQDGSRSRGMVRLPL